MFFGIILFAFLLNGCTSVKTKELDFKWSDITTAKYRNNENVKSIIAVKYKGGYDAEIIMYEKDNSSKNIWTVTLRCDGIVGKNGIGKKKEGDSLALLGNFAIGKALYFFIVKMQKHILVVVW